jgi:GT2 family glycosyltransferase
MISVIIPTYKSPEALDLCLKSIIEGQVNKNEIIVVVDGFYEINKEILEKYSKSINILNLEDNVGTPRATNLGVYNASNELILIANDDNVFPHQWDKNLLESYEPNSIISPNQIEPSTSMFSQFVIENLGRDPKTFDLKKFWEFEKSISKDKVDDTGSTLPLFLSKLDYLRIGGWDETYPHGWVVDWDFVLKAQLSGIKMLRTYKCHLYHFVSLSIKGEEQLKESRIKEQSCHEFAIYKWGTNIKHNPSNNLKYL